MLVLQSIAWSVGYWAVQWGWGCEFEPPCSWPTIWKMYSTTWLDPFDGCAKKSFKTISFLPIRIITFQQIWNKFHVKNEKKSKNWKRRQREKIKKRYENLSKEIIKCKKHIINLYEINNVHADMYIIYLYYKCFFIIYFKHTWWHRDRSLVFHTQ